MNSSIREILKDKKRIVIKIGSSSLTHPETGALNLTKLEVLVREISDLHNMGKDVIVVSGVKDFDMLSDEVEDLPTLYSVDLLNLDTCRNDLLLEDIRQYGRKI